MIREAGAAIKGAKVIGVRERETEETNVSTGRYVEHQKIDVSLTEDGHVDTSDIVRKMAQFLSDRQAPKRP